MKLVSLKPYSERKSFLYPGPLFLVALIGGDIQRGLNKHCQYLTAEALIPTLLWGSYTFTRGMATPQGAHDLTGKMLFHGMFNKPRHDEIWVTSDSCDLILMRVLLGLAPENLRNAMNNLKKRDCVWVCLVLDETVRLGSRWEWEIRIPFFVFVYISIYWFTWQSTHQGGSNVTRQRSDKVNDR